MTFDDNERKILAKLADVLIPAGASMPSASQADVSGQGLEKVLAARPDLNQGLKKLLQAAATRDAAAFVSELQANDSASFSVLAEFVPAAYFLNAEVRSRLGYQGQTPRPIDPKRDYLEDGLLQSVLDRGPIFRPTPK